MKTLLSQFCEEFEQQVRPLIEPLDRFSDDLSRQSTSTPARGVLPQLLDVRHQLKALIEKVAGQQAYVIIFGPLKSGKSTLMNALAADYVSEVTSLPAYPCMVYVGHAPEREISITRYDGSSETFAELASMRMVMTEAHAALAERIREVEQTGETFDPALHMPEAIRRVDVRMPAAQLAESGAVLVDTPGLYSRMKFGYDLMTREFRDAAASAIFVVKTDNLFLEQVFDEFSELLRLFSRIFLVVNIDSAKRDLQPDGELGPSLERKDPQRIVEAFERLSMDAELKRAWEDGRLGIYPVDLLQAASRRLRRDTTSDDAAATEAADDFESFQSDLTDYLNSTDYLVAFLGDSLRQATALAGELRAITAADPVARIARDLEELRGERDEAVALLAAIERLQAYDWDHAFDPLREDITSITHGRIEAVRETTSAEAEARIDAWFESDDSFADLVRRDLGGVLAGCRDEVVETAHGVVKTVVGGDLAGAAVESRVQQDVETVGLSISKIGRASLDTIRPRATGAIEGTEIPAEVVPVRKGFWDWLLFRSRTSVRRRLLGPDDDPALPVPAATKQRRLGEPAREALRGALAERLGRFYDEYLERVATRIFGAYVEAVGGRIRAHLATVRKETENALSVAEARLGDLEALAQDLSGLEGAVRTVGSSVEDLSRRYGDADPAALSEPVDGPEASSPVG